MIALIGASIILHLPPLLHWLWSVTPSTGSYCTSCDRWVIRSGVIHNMRLEIYPPHPSSFGPPRDMALRWLKPSKDGWKRTSFSGIYVSPPSPVGVGKSKPVPRSCLLPSDWIATGHNRAELSWAPELMAEFRHKHCDCYFLTSWVHPRLCHRNHGRADGRGEIRLTWEKVNS